jgi:hypothetical protein
MANYQAGRFLTRDEVKAGVARSVRRAARRVTARRAA